MRKRLAVTAAVVSAAAVVAGPAAVAETPADSRISVRPSNYNPDQGEMFRLSGRMLSEGVPVPGVTVRVQTWRNGGWVPLKGAVVTTNDEGRYRVRVVLFQDGDRDLRVVANPEGDDIRTARKTTVVRVWDPAQR
ncbi:MAG TPA: hypothetical protein VLB29_14705 [Nocardioidaceae bacterium]|nr:hypothetical protein [Nocardioidaceae bacterium]